MSYKIEHMNTKLPTTGYIVLGLLASGSELSGYQIRKMGENLKYFYWSPAQSQIYRELRNLEKHELATYRDVKQEGKPDKRLFRITQQGIDIFKDWMTHAQLPPTMIKHPVLLKLFFMHAVEPTVIVSTLKQYIDSLNETLGQLAIVEEFAADDEENKQTALIVEWNIQYNESELEIAKKLLAQFEEKVA